jgi:hypothetical protein
MRSYSVGVAHQLGSQFRLAYARCRRLRRFKDMKYLSKRAAQSGKLGWILLWLLGVPIPVLLILFLIRGCT